jgi:hypothetical protein
MEILKFDEGDTKPKSRKFSSRGSILVAAVAIMFGASTALAGSTLQINGNDKIELNQGVAQTVQCDDDGIDVSLKTEFDTTSEDFMLSQIVISDIKVTTGGCLDKTLTVKLYGTASDVAFCVNRLAGTPPTGDVGCSDSGKTISGVVDNTGTLTFAFTKTLAITSPTTVKNVTVVSSN